MDEINNLNRTQLRERLRQLNLTKDQKTFYNINGNSTNIRLKDFLNNIPPALTPQVKPNEYNVLRKEARALGYNETNGRRKEQLLNFINNTRRGIFQQTLIQISRQIGVRVIITYRFIKKVISKEYTKEYIISSTLATKDNDVRNLVERFIALNGGEEYIEIINVNTQIVNNVPVYNYLDVPLQRSLSPKLQFFDKNGDLIVDNFNQEKDLCVPEYLKKNIFKEWSLDRIIKEIETAFNESPNQVICRDIFYKPLDDIELNVRENGVSLNQLHPLCDKYRLYMKVIDINGELFHTYPYNNEYTKNKKYPTLMFILYQGHIYNITNECIKKGILYQKNTENFLIHNSKLKNNKEKEDETYIKYFDGMPLNLDNLNKTKFVSTNQDDLYNYFIDELKNNNTYLKTSTDGSTIYDIKLNKNVSLGFNGDYDEILDICQILNRKFENQTYIKLAYDLLYEKCGEDVLKPFKSTFIDKTKEFVSKSINSGWIADYEAYNRGDNLIKYDVNKFYSSILENNEIYWIRCDITNEIKEFNQQDNIYCNCLYYIEPKNFNYLININGVYYPQLVQRALDDGLIKKDEIKSYISCNGFMTNKLKEYVEYIYEILPENYSKELINRFIGHLGKTTKHSGKITYYTDKNLIATKMFEKDNTYVYNIMNDIWAVNNIRIIDNNKNLFMIRNQIIQTGRLKMYDLYKQVGGSLCSVRTDSLVIKNPTKELELTDNRGGIKIETIKYKRQYEIINDIQTSRKNRIELINKQLNDIKIENEYDFNEIYNKTKDKSFFITGDGGCGKTNILVKYIERLEQEGKKILKLAPTHIATKMLDGKTLHSGLGYIKDEKAQTIIYKDIDVVVIDEISMMNTIFYKELLEFKKQDIIVIGAGDFNQLPPVGEEQIKFEKLDVFIDVFENRIKLKINKRIDEDGKKLYQLQQRIIYEPYFRLNSSMLKKWNEPYPCKLNLSYTNDTRKYVNKICMEYYKDDDYLLLKVENDDDDEKIEYSQDTYIYKGLPLRSRKTFKEIDIKNGEQFIVVEYTNKKVILKKDNSRFNSIDDNTLYEIPISKNFLKHFNPNYCMTVHNSQCQSFNEPFRLWEYNRYSKKMLNTAIGRTRNFEFLYL